MYIVLYLDEHIGTIYRLYLIFSGVHFTRMPQQQNNKYFRDLKMVQFLSRYGNEHEWGRTDINLWEEMLPLLKHESFLLLFFLLRYQSSYNREIL